MNRSLIAALAMTLLVECGSALAVAQRTFVSTSGNDLNVGANCSLVAPCRSFGAAMTVTAANGEIVVLDSGGYGQVTITQGVTIDAAAGLYAGISVISGTGVVINAPGADVVLRGLTINGQGGTNGIDVAAATSVRIVRCTLRKLAGTAINATGATNDVELVATEIADAGVRGINVAAVQRFFAQNVQVTRTGNEGLKIENVAAATVIDTAITSAGPGTVSGVRVNATSLASVRASFDRVTVTDSDSSGIIYFVDSSGGTIESTIVRSVFKRNALNGTAAGAVRAFVSGGAAGSVHVGVLDTVIEGNLSDGVQAASAQSVVSVARSSVTDNGGFAFRNSSGTFYTLGDNVVRGNNGQETIGQTMGTITALSPQ